MSNTKVRQHLDMLPDGSVIVQPGLNGIIASRMFEDGTRMGIEPMLFTNRLCIAYPGTIERCWDDVWCFEKDVDVVAALKAWNYPAEQEPMGWHRHPGTGRYRTDGDPEREYTNDNRR